MSTLVHVCGFPLQKPDSYGNIRYCKTKCNFTTNNGTLRCGIHVNKPSSICECAICISECDTNNEYTVVLRCKHAFHHACIFKWTSQGTHTCPMCRAPITKKRLPKAIVVPIPNMANTCIPHEIDRRTMIMNVINDTTIQLHERRDIVRALIASIESTYQTTI